MVVDEDMNECAPRVVGQIVIRGEQVLWPTRCGARSDPVVVLRPGTEATEVEIIAMSRDNLAGYKKPKSVVFLDELPKTVSGKIIKRELRDRFTEGTL